MGSQLKGYGRLFTEDGQFVKDQVRYSITLRQEVWDGPGGSQIAGLQDNYGFVEISADEAFQLLGKNAELELEDRRRVKCWVKNPRGQLVINSSF